MTDYKVLLRSLPAVDRLLEEPRLKEALENFPRQVVLKAVQETIEKFRVLINEHRNDESKLKSLDLSPAVLAGQTAARVFEKDLFGFGPLINATGVVIHTNLGRVPLAAAAQKALEGAALNYNNLELSLKTGKRGSRQDHLEKTICELTGAEAAVVFNNNAAAVFVTLNALAGGREVVVSRGELVEIGGSFRIPAIMAASGATLVEVGTTNKTYRHDYENAVGEHSAALLKVHTSNYQMIGFTASVSTAELAGLARERGLILIEDLGSGVLLDPTKYGLPFEPRVQDSLRSGADVVTFSGDKMLGGPQAGIVAGRRELVKIIKSSQLARTVRIDKFSVAALLATLKLYYDEETALQQIPVWRMLTADRSYLQQRAFELKQKIEPFCGAENVTVQPGISRVGGGAMPNAELPTALVVISFAGSGLSAEQVAEKARQAKPALIMRRQHDSLLLDPRTIFEEQDDLLADSLHKAYRSAAQASVLTKG